MKTTGIVRQMDSLGRIVLPIELRRTLDIAQKDSLEIFVEGDRVILRKYAPASSATTRRILGPSGERTSALPAWLS